ncbi:MAG: PKD domain-containing protein [Bacteroidia bacterium]
MNTKQQIIRLLYSCIFLVLLYSTAYAQNFSNRGKDFWVGHLGHIDGTGSNFKLYISSTVNTSVTVSVPLQSWSTTASISANSFAIIQVPSSIGYVGCSDCTEQRGIHIISNDDVAVYAHIYASARSDATLLLPTKALAKEYFVNTYTQASGHKSEFLVVASTDSTQIEITPTANTNGGKPAGVPFNVTLQEGEIYQVQSSNDLTGSRVRSITNNNDTCKKIAVFAGSTWTTVGCAGAGSGDNLYEQMYPINTWGKNFVTSPFKSRSGDMFRVLAGRNNTTVTIDGVVKTLNQTDFFDTLLFNAAYITADKPITLAQYARTQDCDNNTGDPLMIILSPIEQSINNVLLYNSPEQNITGNYINVVMKTADIGTCLLDGNTITFNPVPSNPIYSYSQNTVTDGSHTLVADSGFNATAYGFGNPESYGYLAGTNIKTIEYQSFSISPNPPCVGTIVTFESNTSYQPTAWKWNFGDGDSSNLENVTHVYSNPGTYIVTLITTNSSACVPTYDTSSYSLVVNGTPNVNFTAPDICIGEPMVFTDSTAIVENATLTSWSWNFGDGGSSLLQNTNHTYATCDSFIVKLIVTSNNGCVDSITKNVVVHCLPVADFSAESVCFNTETLFIDSSVAPNTDSITTWNWTFGDGNYSNNNLPGHTYATPGIFPTKLVVTSNYGCSDSVTKNVEVYHNPTSYFTANNVCWGDSVYFHDSSTIVGPASINSHLWLFGDGTPTNSQVNPVYFYSNPGTYSVALLVQSTDGCSGFYAQTINVFDFPKSVFQVNNVCLYDSALFNNTSVSPSMGSIASWLWSFGDSSNPDSINYNTQHIYSSPGEYVVSLVTRSSNLACSDTTTDTLTIYPLPIASFVSEEVCLNNITNFTDSSTVPLGSIIEWGWDFSDGENAVNQNPTHTFSTHGAHNVQLIVKSSNGCLDSITQIAIVHALPDAQFNFQNVCHNQPVLLTSNSSIPNNPSSDIITNWAWSLGDSSNTINTENANHLYASAGSYNVQLVVESTFGCKDSVVNTIFVNPNPTVEFTATDTINCSPLCTTLQNTSFVSTGTIASWSWNLGDGSPAENIQNPTHCYNNQSNTTITISPSLTATSDSGCVTTITKNNYLTILPNPIAQFNTSPTNAPITNPVITVSNSSTGADYWTWNFGDSDSSFVESPEPHLYADTGIYQITLITSTQLGCFDTTQQTIIIEPSFLIYIPNAFTPNGDEINDSFIPKGAYINKFEMLIFDRWGNLVYKTDDLNKPWDGKVKNGAEPAQTDVYIYSINLSNFKNEIYKYKGTVTLIR